MEIWMARLLIYLCVFISAKLVQADTFKIFMVSAGTCGNEMFNVNRGTSYSVVWKGDNPGSAGCRYRFQTDLQDRNVCVDVKEFYFEKSGIYLRLYEVPNNTVTKVYEKGSLPKTYCSSAGKHIELELSSVYDDQNSLMTARSYFTLTVFAGHTVENKPGNNTGIKLGFSIFGSLIAIVVIAILIKLIFFRSRLKPKEHVPSFQSTHTAAVSLPANRMSAVIASPKQPEMILTPRDLNVGNTADPSTNEAVHFNKDTEQLIV